MALEQINLLTAESDEKYNIDKLPQEIINMILLFLSPKDSVYFALSSKMNFFKESDDALWKARIIREGLSMSTKCQGDTYKTHFFKNYFIEPNKSYFIAAGPTKLFDSSAFSYGDKGCRDRKISKEKIIELFLKKQCKQLFIKHKEPIIFISKHDAEKYVYSHEIMNDKVSDEVWSAYVIYEIKFPRIQRFYNRARIDEIIRNRVNCYSGHHQSWRETRHHITTDLSKAIVCTAELYGNHKQVYQIDTPVEELNTSISCTIS